MTFKVNAQLSENKTKTIIDSLFELKEYDLAIDILDAGIDENNEQPWQYQLRAELLFSLDYIDDAVDNALYAIRLDTLNSQSFNTAANIYSNIGNFNYAHALYTRAIEVEPSDSLKLSLMVNRASNYTAQRNFTEAIRELKYVLRENPNSFGAHNNIANIYDQLKDYDLAISHLQKAIEIDSTSFIPYINLGFYHGNMKKPLEALKYYNKAVDLGADDPLLYNNRGYTYYLLEKYDLALTDIFKSLEEYPTNSYAYRNLALVYIALEDSEKACIAINKALEWSFTLTYGNEVQDLFDLHCANSKS